MSPFLSFYCRNRIGKKKLRDSIITSAVQQLCLEMTFHVRTTRRVIRRSTCQTSPSARNEVTSDDGSRKTGAAGPEGIRLEIIEGPVAFRAFLAVSRSRSSRVVVVLIVSYAPDARRPGMHACISQILIFSLLSRRRISNADTWRDIGKKTLISTLHLPRVSVILQIL